MHLRDQGVMSPSLLSTEPGGGAQAFASEDAALLPLTTRTLQAASFITPVWTVLFLVAALDGRDTSPIPTLELVSTAGAQRCQERARGESQGRCGAGTALLPQPPPSPPLHIQPWQKQNRSLSLGVFGGHLAKAQNGETEAQRGGRLTQGHTALWLAKAGLQLRSPVSHSTVSPQGHPSKQTRGLLWSLHAHYLTTSSLQQTPPERPVCVWCCAGVGNTEITKSLPIL